MTRRTSFAKFVAILMVAAMLLTTFGVAFAEDPTPAAPAGGKMDTGLFASFDAAKCYAPKASDTPKIKVAKKEGPYRIGFSNAYIGNDWRTEMIQMARAYVNLPEIKPPRQGAVRRQLGQ